MDVGHDLVFDLSVSDAGKLAKVASGSVAAAKKPKRRRTEHLKDTFPASQHAEPALNSQRLRPNSLTKGFLAHEPY